ncbi:MAG: TlpA disulfide reductase family protein [Pseudomonadota bacterium]
MSSRLRLILVLGAVAIGAGLAAWWWQFARPPADFPPPAALHFTPLSKPRPVPDAVFYDEEYRERRFADWRGKGIVLNLWATWCGPCVRELPTLDRLAGLLAGEDIVVLALALDRGGLAVVKPFYEELGINRLAIYLDPKGRVAKAFGLVGVPVTAFIDHEGRVLGSHAGLADWDTPEALALVRSYLGKPVAGD